jgi:hypothetical protein
MATKLIIAYVDGDGEMRQHCIVSAAPSLMYDDLQVEPIEVRTIARRGLIIGHVNEDLTINRDGIYIPPHRITEIRWWDDCE